MPTCPQGHTSVATDYCDTCGAQIVDAPAPAPDVPVAVAPAADDPAASKVCPHCDGPNPGSALFCEECGYDFTTGALPWAAIVTDPAPVAPVPDPFEPAEPASSVAPVAAALDLDAPVVLPSAPEDAESGDAEIVDAELVDDAASPEAAPALDAPAAEAAGGDSAAEVPDGDRDAGGADAAADSPAEADASPHEPAETEADAALVEPVGAPSGPDAASESAAPDVPSNADEPAVASGLPIAAPENVAAPGPARWVAELWIDPDWYAGQDSPDQLPSPGLPRVIGLVKRSSLIGRPSRSRGIVPDLDCEPDTGVSRRHAELTTDGTRWWVEDLGSSNGTYVGEPGAALPVDPIRMRTELVDGARVYVGSWTRIVIRPADADEEF